MKLKYLTLFLFLLPVVSAECIDPESGMKLNSSVEFCSGEFTLNSAINIIQDDVSISCSNTILKCALQTGEALLVNSDKLNLQGCTFSNCGVGLHLSSSANSIIKDNNFINNIVGISIELRSHDPTIIGNNFESGGSVGASLSSVDSESILLNNQFAESVTPMEIAPYEEEQAIEGELINETIESEPIVEEIIEEEIPFSSELVLDEGLFSEVKVISVLEDIVKIKMPDKDIDAFYNEYFDSKSKVQLKHEFNITNNETFVNLIILPNEALKDLDVYEKIPKCFSQYLNNIVFEDMSYEVIDPDPLVTWHFDQIDKVQEMKYSIGKKIDKDCIKMFISLGIVKGIEQEIIEEDVSYFSIFLVILVIFLFGYGIIKFSQFRQENSVE